MKLAHIWRTAIQTAVAGKDKRTALFTWPRIKINNKYLISGTKRMNQIKRNLIFRVDAIWGIPLWPDITTLAAQAASGQKILAVAETAYRHFYAGRNCIIISASDPDSYEVGVINVLASAQITLVGNLTSTWPAGSFVLPLYDCRIASAQKVSGANERRQVWYIEAMEAFEDARSFSYSLPSSGAAQYESIDLLTLPMDKPIEYGFARPYDMQQFLGLGYAYSRFATGDNNLSFKSAATLSSRPQIRELLDFFDSQMGRHGDLWVPSWSRDIVPTVAIGASDTEITIDPIDYDNTYLANDVIGRHVFVYFPDKSYVCRKIIDATAETIELDSALGTAVSASQLKRLMISFLNYVRFDLDELEVSYPYNHGARGKAELNFKALLGEEISL
ncbi:MAG: hypothetical protein WC905_01305 [Patescibacteria group bacterium]|jgi:hypothetical protein